jgi:hypothetical protein
VYVFFLDAHLHCHDLMDNEVILLAWTVCFKMVKSLQIILMYVKN